MNRIRILSALSAAVLVAGLAHGANYTSSQSGPWGSASTWGGAGVPVAGDTVTIGTGHTVTINVSGANNVQQVQSLTIDSGGFLSIQGSASYRAALEFPVVSGAATPSLSVAGADALKLQAYGELKVLESMTVTNGGSGSIKGFASTAKIVMDGSAAAVTLTLDAPVHGAVQFEGTVGNTENLANNAGISADINGDTIVFADSLNSLDDASGNGRWEVATSAGMTFAVAASGLEGGFKLQTNGLFTFEAAITTTGLFELACGNNPVEVAVNGDLGGSFTYGGVDENCDGDKVPNPIQADYDCVCK